MIDVVTTYDDLRKLPSYLQNAINYKGGNPHNLRFRENINKAERKQILHNAVKRAVIEKEITVRLGIEILQTNNAYGPQGKTAINEAINEINFNKE